MYRVPNCNVDELSYGLEILRNDLTSMFALHHNGDGIPILYDVSVFTTGPPSRTKDIYFEQSPNLLCCSLESPQNNDDTFLEALQSCNFYLNALSNERSNIDTSAYPNFNNCYSELNNKMEKNIFQSNIDVKEHLELFREKAWKSFAEINSFCKSLMSICKFLAPQTAEADEVLYDFKHSIEVYERAISFDISCLDNAEKLLCALDNVKNSTRSLQTFVWTIKTLMTYSEPTTSK